MNKVGLIGAYLLISLIILSQQRAFSGEGFVVILREIGNSRTAQRVLETARDVPEVQSTLETLGIAGKSTDPERVGRAIVNHPWFYNSFLDQTPPADREQMAVCLRRLSLCQPPGPEGRFSWNPVTGKLSIDPPLKLCRFCKIGEVNTYEDGRKLIVGGTAIGGTATCVYYIDNCKRRISRGIGGFFSADNPPHPLVMMLHPDEPQAFAH